MRCPSRRKPSLGCIKLQFEGSPERGGDSLSPQFQAHSAGDKLSPPRKAELDAALQTFRLIPFLAVQRSGRDLLLAGEPNSIHILPPRLVPEWDAASGAMNRLPQRLSLPAQTAAILKEEIQAGRWCKWMPGEHDLCRQLHVGRVTLRAALAQLQREGWVRSHQGKRRQIVARRGRLPPAASGRVVLLTPAPMQLLRPFTILWTNELREHLAEAGYELETHGSHAFYGQGWAANLEVLVRQLRPVGFVLTATTDKMQRWFSDRGMPCVIAGSRHPGIELPCVDGAYRAVCRHAAGQFLARGHVRLAFLNPDSGAAGELESEAGFNEALAQTGHADVQASVVRHDETVAHIRRKVDVLLRQQNPPTAFLVSRAANVLPVMGHLMSRGLRLPQDVALISRDHEPYLERVVPSVARYVINPSTMANRVASAVLQVMQGRMPTPADCHIMPEFTEGETLGPGTIRTPVPQTLV